MRDHWNKLKDQKKLEALCVLPEQKWYEFDSSNKASYNCSVENYILFLISSSNSDGKEKLHIYKRGWKKEHLHKTGWKKEHLTQKRLEKKQHLTKRG